MTMTQKMNIIANIYKLMEDAKIKRIEINPKYNYDDVFTFEDGQTIEIGIDHTPVAEKARADIGGRPAQD